MDRLNQFISAERDRFEVDDGNIFAISFGKPSRHWIFLEEIRARYHTESSAFVDNSKAFQVTVKPGGPHQMTEEQMELQRRGSHLNHLVHLEIESYYLFAKIFLDEMAHALENYFGPARGLAIDSHDDLAKRLEHYASAKGLKVSDRFKAAVSDMRRRISDFRDQQVAHEKSPRTAYGTMWDASGNVMRVSNRIYPRDSDKQSNSETLDSLAAALGAYADAMGDFLDSNKALARFKLALDRSAATTASE